MNFVFKNQRFLWNCKQNIYSPYHGYNYFFLIDTILLGASCVRDYFLKKIYLYIEFYG